MPGARVAIVGGGPAGLMAADTLASDGVEVTVFDAMPTLGRKFLLAGKGGLNLTHGEPFTDFVQRYEDRRDWLRPWLLELGPERVRAFAEGLGVPTFVGSSGRVFPVDMKAAPLLRSWLRRLRGLGVRVRTRHRWCGWETGDAPTTLRFAAPDGALHFAADAVVLALGGASWRKLGSDGAWVPWLEARGVVVRTLLPANCGFEVAWSPYFVQHAAGKPLKSVTLTLADATGAPVTRAGELMLTATGIEGSLVYACARRIRETVIAHGTATVHLDLVPGRSEERLLADLARPPRPKSWSDHLRSRTGIDGVKLALVREVLQPEAILQRLATDPRAFVRLLKAWPLVVRAARPIDEAISTAGGVARESLDDACMLRECEGVFCAGEMLDWEAPTGGYLLTACLASGAWSGKGALAWLRARTPRS